MGRQPGRACLDEVEYPQLALARVDREDEEQRGVLPVHNASALAEPLGRVNEVAHAVWSCVERAKELLHYDLLLLLGL